MTGQPAYPGWPRGLSVGLAAKYVSLSESAFLASVDAGHAPAPAWITKGRKIWLRDDLDGWLDRLFARGVALEATGNDWLDAIDHEDRSAVSIRAEGKG